MINRWLLVINNLKFLWGSQRKTKSLYYIKVNINGNINKIK